MTNKHDHWQCGFGMFSFLERLVIVGAQGTQVPSDSSRVTTGIPEPMGHLGVLLQSHHFAASPSPNQCQVLTFTMSQCHGDLGFQWRGWTNRPYPGEGEVWWSRPAYEFPNGGNMTKRYRCFRDVVMLRVPANHSGPDHPDHDLVTWNPWWRLGIPHDKKPPYLELKNLNSRGYQGIQAKPRKPTSRRPQGRQGVSLHVPNFGTPSIGHGLTLFFPCQNVDLIEFCQFYRKFGLFGITISSLLWIVNPRDFCCLWWNAKQHNALQFVEHTHTRACIECFCTIIYIWYNIYML